MIKCEISVSKDIDKYWKNCTIKDLAEATISRLAGYYISYSAEEYLKDTGLMTVKKTITKKGKSLIHAYYAGERGSIIRLNKPQDVMEYKRN